MSRRLLPLGLAAIALTASACTSAKSIAIPEQPTLTTTPPPTITATNAPACARASDPNKASTISLTPSALPPPGLMPAGTFMAEIQKRGRLIVGVSPDTKLFGAINPLNDNQFEGFDVEIAKEVANAIFGDPNKIEFHSVTNAQRIPFIQAGTVDMVAHTMTINCERRKSVDFSSVYFQAGQKVLVVKNPDITKLSDLAGKKICAPDGTTSLANLSRTDIFTAGLPIAVSHPDETDCLVDLQNGIVDAVSTDDTILAGMAAQDPFTEVLDTKQLTEEPYGLAVSLAHPEFTRFVNAVLEKIKASGRWNQIYVETGVAAKLVNLKPPQGEYSG